MAASEAIGYNALKGDGCGLRAARPDGKLLVSGPDAAEMLDGQLSNEIGALKIGSGCEATLLTPKGRIIAPLRALATAEGILLLTERATLQALFDRLRYGILGWNAQLHKRTLELGRLELVGGGSDAVLKAAELPLPGPAEHDHEGGVVRTALGVDLLVEADREQALRERLLAAGCQPVDEQLVAILRVEAGRPAWGRELDEKTMPEEAGMVERAVSFTKGCYVGQETVARLHWRGRPNRHLRALVCDAPVTEGDLVTAATGRELGRVATAVISPARGPLALALLRREVGPGDRVTIGGTTGAELLAAQS